MAVQHAGYAQIVAALSAAPEEPCGASGALLTEWRRTQAGSVCLVCGDAGVGSVATMLAALRRARGRRAVQVGARHPHRWRERIRAGSSPLSEDDFAAALSGWEHGEMSADEILLGGAIALASTDEGSDLIIEAPPASPVWSAPVTANLVAVARIETAGWVEECLVRALNDGSTIVMAPQRESVADAVRAAAKVTGATLHEVATECRLGKAQTSADGQQFSVETPSGQYKVMLPLLGAHQQANFLTALLAAGDVGVGAVAKALEEVKLPLRLEVLKRSPLVVLDGADNAASLKATARAAPSVFGRSRLSVIAAVGADTAVEALAEAVAEVVAPIDGDVRVAFGEADREAAEQVYGLLRERGVSVQLGGAAAPVLLAAIDGAGPRDGVLLLGSMSVAAEARAHLLGLQEDFR